MTKRVPFTIAYIDKLPRFMSLVMLDNKQYPLTWGVNGGSRAQVKTYERAEKLGGPKP